MMKNKTNHLLILGLITVLLSACGVIRGSGEVITVSRDVSDFNEVVLSGVGTLHITLGEKESLKIAAEENLLPYIETQVRANRLEIGINRDRWNTAIQPTEPILYYLTVTELDGVELSGAGNVEVEEIDTANLRVVASGAGNILIGKLITDKFSAEVSGAGSCRIFDGEVKFQDLRISGAGGYQAGDLKSQKTTIDISGLGGAKVWAEESLRVTISGAGSVDFYGQPNIFQEINGLGNINALGLK